SLIESRYGRRVAEVRQDIRAVSVPKTLATALRVPSGTPALKIARWYLDTAGHVFEASGTVHPAERFSVSMRLRRSDSWAKTPPRSQRLAGRRTHGQPRGGSASPFDAG